MLGTHQLNDSSSGSHNKVQPTMQILKEFLLNEEGFLSSNYTETLKKFYPLDFAEHLYVLHGTTLSLLAKLHLSNSAYNNNRGRRQKNFLDKVTHSRLFSVSMDSKSNEEACRRKLSEQLGLYSESGTVNRARTAYDNYIGDSGVNTFRASWIVHAFRNLCGTESGIGLCDFQDRLLDGIKHLDTIRVSRGLHSRYQRPPQEKDPIDLDRISIAFQNNMIGAAFYTPEMSRPWLEACPYNLEHVECLKEHGTASALQAFFHTPQVKGYDGAEVLSIISGGAS